MVMSEILPVSRHERVYPVFASTGISPQVSRIFQEIEASALSKGRSDACVRNLLFTLAICIKPRRILEIGSHIGAGTIALACACRLNDFGCVTGLEPNETFYRALERNLQQSGVSAWARILKVFSHDPHVIETLAAEGEFQLMFIDARHDFQAVKKELTLYGPMLAPNGLMVLHDTSTRSMALDKQGQGGVRRAILEFCRENSLYKEIFFEYPLWGNPTGTCLICKQDITM
jgi:predicted O-methyltransferase YrrM